MAEVSQIAAATGKIPSGLFIVTAAAGGRKEGYLASWVQQAGFSPLLISVAIRPGRHCYALIKEHGRFCLNVIGKHNGGVMKPFWTPAGDADPFAGLAFSVSKRGNIILQNALAALECEVRSSSQPGDHEILIAEVMEGHVLAEDAPLTHVRRDGSDY